MFYKIINNKFSNIHFKMIKSNEVESNKTNNKYKKIIENIVIKIKEIISLSLSAQILIFPISILLFNKISLTFVLSNILVSLVIGTIIIFGFVVILFQFKFLFNILNFLLEFLKNIASFFSNLEFSKIILVTPKWWQVAIYYILVLGITYLFYLKIKENKRVIEKKILTNVYKFKCYIFSKKRAILIVILIIIIQVQIINSIPKDLKVHFIDVGQGDSTFIITPTNKTILLDVGGSKDNEFDVRKKYFITISIR